MDLQVRGEYFCGIFKRMITKNEDRKKVSYSHLIFDFVFTVEQNPE